MFAYSMFLLHIFIYQLNCFSLFHVAIFAQVDQSKTIKIKNVLPTHSNFTCPNFLKQTENQNNTFSAKKCNDQID